MGDMADPSLGVWFELCKGRNERGGAVCFDYFFTGGSRFKGGWGPVTSLT